MNNYPIYITNNKNTHRFAFGSIKKKPLFVMGLNPSGLPDRELNSTLRNVEAFSKILGFDSFVMINLYSQGSLNNASFLSQNDIY